MAVIGMTIGRKIILQQNFNAPDVKGGGKEHLEKNIFQCTIESDKTVITMPMQATQELKSFRVKCLGPITEANVEFGDLTFLVGPQASGKSIFLQLLKLLIDKNSIRHNLERFSYVWKKREEILDRYFGNNAGRVWSQQSTIIFNGKRILNDFVLPKKGNSTKRELLFYIPAQRVLSIDDGRIKTFKEFRNSAPYILRQFSETLWNLSQDATSVFPNPNELKSTVREKFDNAIFHGGKVKFDEEDGQKKIKMEIAEKTLPFLTWSAGQKEFLPLLMSFQYLCPPSKVSKRDDYDYVVIEEPEMGLHPQAIQSVILQTLDLLHRGYKVMISTHSPVFLEFAWAFQILQKSNEEKGLYDLFGLKKSRQASQIMDKIFEKRLRTYFFSRLENGNVVSKDISSLDALTDDSDVADWGGISQFAGRAVDIVTKYAEK